MLHKVLLFLALVVAIAAFPRATPPPRPGQILPRPPEKPDNRNVFQKTFEYVFNSFGMLFKPFEGEEPDPVNVVKNPNIQKAKTIGDIRKEKRSAWAKDDIRESFIEYFVPKKIVEQPKPPAAPKAKVINPDDSAAGYVAKGAQQAFSPLKNEQVTKKPLPKFHRSWNLSKLRHLLGKNPKYYDD
eukprot:gene1115-1218_t